MDARSNGRFRWLDDGAAVGCGNPDRTRPAPDVESGSAGGEGPPTYGRAYYDNVGYDLDDDDTYNSSVGGAKDPDDLDDSDVDEAVEDCCYEVQHNFAYFWSELRGQGGEMRHTLSKMDFKVKLKSCFTVEKLKQIVPIIEWAPKYRMAELQGDLIAGFTVGLTVLPQAIAYSNIANVDPAYGLYSAFIGCFVYTVFGSSKDITLGPSAIMSLMTASYGISPVPKDPTYAIALGFYTGIVQMIMWLIGIGYLIDFISFPVMKAFTSAAAITIGMSQVKKWWGLKGVPRDFIPQLIGTIQKIPQTRIWDFVLGVVCIVVIIVLGKMKAVKWKKSWEELSIGMKILNKTIWLLGTARNIIVIVLASVAAFIWLENGIRPFSLIGYIPPGIPSFKAPKLSLYDPAANKTYSESEVAVSMFAGMIVTPIIGLIEAMAIGKVFSRKFNYKMDANQEFLSYGIANFLGAFVMGYPITGTFSRTAVNAASGVKTQAGGLVTGALVLLALQFLTPLFYYIPEASLAVVIIMAVLDMMSFHKVWIFFKQRRIDLIPWIVTFVLSFVLSVESGIFIGVIVSLVILLFPSARPQIKTYEIDSALWNSFGSGREKPNILVVELDSGLMFPAVPHVRDQIVALLKDATLNGLILDFAHIANIDTTTIQGLRELLEDCHKKGVKTVTCNLQKQPQTVLRRANPQFFVKALTLRQAVQIIAGIADNPKKLPQIANQSKVISGLVRNEMATRYADSEDVFDAGNKKTVYPFEINPLGRNNDDVDDDGAGSRNVGGSVGGSRGGAGGVASRPESQVNLCHKF